MQVFPIDSSGEMTKQVTLNVGTGQMKQIFRGMMQYLKEQGYKAIRVEPQYRVGGANVGGYTKEFTIRIR
jgi:predicted CoA-binding protein